MWGCNWIWYSFMGGFCPIRLQDSGHLIGRKIFSGVEKKNASVASVANSLRLLSSWKTITCLVTKFYSQKPQYSVTQWRFLTTWVYIKAIEGVLFNKRLFLPHSMFWHFWVSKLSFWFFCWEEVSCLGCARSYEFFTFFTWTQRNWEFRHHRN